MKKLFIILLLAFMLSCEKEQCWECKTYFDIQVPDIGLWDEPSITIQCNLSNEEITEFENKNTSFVNDTIDDGIFKGYIYQKETICTKK